MIIIVAILIVVTTFLIHNKKGKEKAILKSVKRKYKVIKEHRDHLAQRVMAGERLPVYEEWLFDNIYLIEQIQNEIQSALTNMLYKKLSKGGNFPCMYHVAKELCRHYEYRLKEEDIIAGLKQADEKRAFKNIDIWSANIFFSIVLIDRIYETCLTFRERDFDKEAAEINMASAILSIISLGCVNWDKVFDFVSQVEQILLGDPTNTYRNMDNQTKAYYRYSVEKLAKQLKVSETDIANTAITLAKNPFNQTNRERHVGYYLIDDGRQALLSEYRDKISGGIRFKQTLLNNRIPLYLTLLHGLTVLCCFGLFLYSRWMGLSLIGAIVLALLSLLPVSEIITKTINWTILHIINVKPVPKLELMRVPQEGSTFVVVPTLVTSAKRARELVKNLELMYLTNQSENLYFAVLGDFKDAKTETDVQDAQIINAAFEEINALNERYGKRFYYFHRSRVKDEKNDKYMGWERKRGALLEFVRLLKGENTSYSFYSTPINELPKVYYVLTLDSDTRLLKSSAYKLIGAMLHPLNRAVVDVNKHIVTKGYGLLQPRITVDIKSCMKSAFSRIFAGQGGIDPYSMAISDIYQDVFAEGIFTGKGIFDVDTFHTVFHDLIPDNTILSHDLLEGSFMRTGLVSDVSLQDGFPYKYIAYSLRQHRWIRGDWQLLPYLKGTIKNAKGEKIKNPLGIISKYKIYDNLRRSLVWPRVLALILFAFLIKAQLSYIPLAVAFVSILITLITCWVDAALCSHHDRDIPHYTSFLKGLKTTLEEVALLFLFLPYNTYISLDAVIRTVVRVCFTKQRLLEWVTAEETEKLQNGSLGSTYRCMYVQFIASALVILFSVLFTPYCLWLALLFTILWIIAPYVAYKISKPITQHERISQEEKYFIREIALKTWRYYHDFCGVKENYLPPDNYQKEPYKGVAHRTSPTNIGLLLASYMSAHDFGYITASDMIFRMQKTLDAIDCLPKYNGHLYNWYDTLTLEPLRPRFISTVDNGNLICLIVTVKNGLRALLCENQFDKRILNGIRDILAVLGKDTSLVDQAVLHTPNLSDVITLLEKIKKNQADKSYWGKYLIRLIDDYIKDCHETINCEEINALITRLDNMIRQTDFRFLYNENRKLFSVGFNVEEGKIINAYYDLLATEARQTSFIAVAKGDVTEAHWFKLCRGLVDVDGKVGLISWTGTMFEYLMPMLLMSSHDHTLMGETYQMVLTAGKTYCHKKHKVWGISECAFFSFDRELNYQYKPLGIPRLAIKRDTHTDYVVSPYSGCLALMVDPQTAIENLHNLCKIGALGEYGFYESIDFTQNHLYDNAEFAIIKSYMVHHLGMSFLAFDNVVHDNIMQKRFHEEPCVKGCEYLLEEKMPGKAVLLNNRSLDPRKEPIIQAQTELYSKSIEKLEVLPNSHVLSNGKISCFINDRGGGYLKVGNSYVNRFSPDLKQHKYGNLFYLKDNAQNKWFSIADSPMGLSNNTYKVRFYSNGAEFSQTVGDIFACMAITIANEDSVELREITIENQGEDNVFDILSYMEVILTNSISDEAHPAFSNLFIHTEYIPDGNIIIAGRRSRTREDKCYYVAQCVTVDHEFSYETDRMRFLGRGNDVYNPKALNEDCLSETTGAVLDPILSIRTKLSVKRGEKKTVTFITAVGDSFEDVALLCRKYKEIPNFAENSKALQNRAKIENGFLALNDKDEEIFEQMLSALFYVTPQKKHLENNVINNKKGQPDLWAFAISGDNPIVLYQMFEGCSTEGLQFLIKALLYLKFKGVVMDLVIVDENYGDYHNNITHKIDDIIARFHVSYLKNMNGGIYVIARDQINEEDANLFISVAQLVFHSHTPIEDQMNIMHQRPQMREAKFQIQPNRTKQSVSDAKALAFFNGYGGFSEDEYVLRLSGGNRPPLPWSNVVANKHFGFVSTSGGGGYTWAENSREYKLTQWSNNAVTDPQGEMFYVRDNDDGDVFCPTVNPLPDDGNYEIHYGFGYSQYLHEKNGILLDLTQFVAMDDMIKLSCLKIKNTEVKERNLSVFYYVRPILGALRSYTVPFIATSCQNGILTAKNYYNAEFHANRLFMHTTEDGFTFTGDRSEFYYDKDGYSYALKADTLSGNVGTGLDACLAIKLELKLAPNEEKTIGFKLGCGKGVEDIQRLCKAYSSVSDFWPELERVKSYWKKMITTIEVVTPDEKINKMLDGWLIYQTLCCRMYARTAFYQAGGAFGFRDQLQDSLAMLYADPEITKNQIIKHAEHQFIEGDVQHWWHENPNIDDPEMADKGIRTKFSDDLLWLPYVLCQYIKVTGDKSLLEINVPYIEGDILEEDEDEKYDVARKSVVSDSIYQHALRAIERSLNVGEHGIPLMGSGDWNDGMSTVGNEGKGESVWLGWFLCDILEDFAPLCKEHGDEELYQKLVNHRTMLTQNLNQNAWDGAWFRRAYFDDGTPLGSHTNTECKIDAIAQAWAKISGVGEEEKVKTALGSLEEYLVDNDIEIIKLLTPPFGEGDLSPGYIKSYVMGVRENGGQYTHGAVWAIMAIALDGQGDKAVQYYNMLTPINHSDSKEKADLYKTEPYVMSADVYSAYPHAGRGGWSWYTGASGWMYKVAVETILGFQKTGDKLTIQPSISKDWKKYHIRYRYETSIYEIEVQNPNNKNVGVTTVSLNGTVLEDGVISLVDDGQTHRVIVIL